MFLQTIRRSAAVGLLLLAQLFFLPAQETRAQGRDWEPRRTWVFVVGTLRWKHEEMFDSFPQENRRDAELVEFFEEQGVPAGQIVYLKDREATARRIQTSLNALLSRAQRGDWLFLYYTGHGYKADEGDDTYLASYDAGDEGVPGWAVRSIPAAIEKSFRGSRAFLALDNCYSGALAEAVTGRRNRVSYAVLTSAPSDQSSTAEWTFTEALLAALRGKAYGDTDDDGRITLAEVAGEVEEDMAFAEKQHISFATTGEFDRQTVISLTEERREPRVGERVVVRSEGSWYKGRIIGANQAGTRFLIDYYGWDDSYDEWVTPKQIRRPKAKRSAFSPFASVE